MKFKRTLVFGLLAGAMVGLSSLSAPAFAAPAYSPDSNYIRPVDWWWYYYQNDPHGYANYGWHKGYYSLRRPQSTPVLVLAVFKSQVWQDRRSGHPAAANDVEAGSRGGAGTLLQPQLISF